MSSRHVAIRLRRILEPEHPVVAFLDSEKMGFSGWRVVAINDGFPALAAWDTDILDPRPMWAKNRMEQYYKYKKLRKGRSNGRSSANGGV